MILSIWILAYINHTVDKLRVTPLRGVYRLGLQPRKYPIAAYRCNGYRHEVLVFMDHT